MLPRFARFYVLISFILMLLPWSEPRAQEASAPGATLFQNVRIFDGKSDALSGPSNVLVMGNVIEPLVLGRRVGLSPFAMIAAASFWTLVWGPVGLLLAAPLTMALVVVGRYIQGLSFISVLLGDEPALEPEQELYHRLLSSDALAAADQIETAMEDTSLAQASDRLVLPALALAANDVRTARLGEPQLETIGKTLDEATELHEDLASKPERDDEDAQVVIVAARGMVDVMAAKFLARVIEADTHQATRAIERSTGLTALALGGFNDGDSRPASIVIVSVAGLPKRQLELMAARASRSFPESGIIVLSAATVAEPVPSPGSASQAAKSGPSAPEAKHISTVVELIGNLKVQRGPSPATAEVDGGAAIATPAGAE